MKTEYILEGLDCPTCAAKIETDIKSLNGVSSASCNAVNSTLVLVMEKYPVNNIAADIEKIVHKYEPHVVVTAKEFMKTDKTDSHSDGEYGQIIQFIIGAVIFVAALFAQNTGIQPYLYFASYAVLGWRVIYNALRTIFRGQIFDENFLMSVATAGAFVIGEFPEAVAVMMFYLVGEFFQEAAVRKSKKSISDLMDIRPDHANIKRNGDLVQVNPESVQVGDIIVVKPGEKIPLDGIVIKGESMLDAKALTGESAPKSVTPSDTVLSGCINQSGVLTIEVTKPFGESTVSKIIDLVENASGRKAPTEKFITKFAKYYTPVVVGLALILAIVPPLFLNEAWSDWIRRALVFLVISCPCALVISIPLSFFGGIGNASRNGILVKGSNYLEALNNIDIAVFDKTGTLTEGVFKVTDIIPANGATKSQILEYAAHAEAFSNHPVAVSILKAYGKTVNKGTLSNYKETAGCGVGVTLSSGAAIFAGNAKLMKEKNIAFSESGNIGTKIYVAADEKYIGCIIISDELKADSRDTITALKAAGVKKTVMLTGDDTMIAKDTAEKLSIDEVYSQLLPNQKVEIVERLCKQKKSDGKLVFVGDGINDAPVLARADIGVAMGGLGSDAAIEAADIVLMTDEPSKLVAAMGIARATKRIVWQNIIFALGIKIAFLMLGAAGISGMWEAVFADVGVSVLAILNSLRAVR